MELKKSPQADLENKKGLYGSLGLVLALAIVLVAFEWKSYDNEKIEVAARTAIETEEESETTSAALYSLPAACPLPPKFTTL